MSIAASSPRKHTNHIRRTMNDRWAKIVAYVIVGLFGLVCLYPLLLTVTVSLTPERVIDRDGFRLIPAEFSLDTYTYIFAHSGERILRSYGVTTLVTVAGTFFSMLVTCMISYAISLREMKYWNVIGFICNFTTIFSAGLVPWYVVCRQWYGLANNILGLILPPLFSVWSMFLMRTYFKAISPSLYEAAKIDGAGHWTIFFRNLFPLQYYLYQVVSNVNAVSSGRVPSGAAANLRLPAETVKMAVTIITIGPIIFLYPFIQRYFVQGIMTGAVKE